MGAIKLVIFDIAGTTAKDDGLVVEAFESAMVAMGVNAGSPELEAMTDYVNATMGQRKIDVFFHLLDCDLLRAEIAHLEFITAFKQLIRDGRMTEFEGITPMFRVLQASGVEVAVTTGFPRELLTDILTATKWCDALLISVAADEVAQGRPAPDMIHRAIEIYNNAHTKKISVAQVAVVGDTRSDIGSGVAANCAIVAGVLSGAHSADELRREGATHIFASAVEITALC